jgi:hypothetical protein
MVKRDLGFPSVDTGYKDRLVEYLQFKGDPKSVEMSRLRGWVGPVPDMRDFDLEDQRRGILFRVVVNLKRLACLLEPLALEKVHLWDSTGTGVRSVGLSGEDWRIILGGLDRDPDEPLEEDEDPIPVFTFEEMSAFDRAMALLEED